MRDRRGAEGAESAESAEGAGRAEGARGAGRGGGGADHGGELSREVIGAAIEVHRGLGPGLLESAYQACLAWELQERGVRFRVQVPLPVVYKGVRLECGYRLDFVIDDSLVVEIKAVERLAPVHDAQLLTYLRLTGLPLGLLINFNRPTLASGVRRLALSSTAASAPSAASALSAPSARSARSAPSALSAPSATSAPSALSALSALSATSAVTPVTAVPAVPAVPVTSASFALSASSAVPAPFASPARSPETPPSPLPPPPQVH